MPIVINTEMFEIFTQSDFDELVEVVRRCNVVKLFINHQQPFSLGKKILRFSPNQLEMIIDEVPKIKIALDCLAFTEENIEEFCKIISKKKNCELYMHIQKLYYLFSIKDIELMAKYDIKLTELSSYYLKIFSAEDDYSLQRLCEALAKMKHLKSFEFYFRHVPTLIDHFIKLPITWLSTGYFDISGKDKIEKVVHTLSQIKSLRYLYIDHWNYKLEPEDLAMFKELPVKSIDIVSLHLTNENIPEFRRIISGMNVEGIHSLDSDEFEELNIDVETHGLGGMYINI